MVLITILAGLHGLQCLHGFDNSFNCCRFAVFALFAGCRPLWAEIPEACLCCLLIVKKEQGRQCSSGTEYVARNSCVMHNVCML